MCHHSTSRDDTPGSMKFGAAKSPCLKGQPHLQKLQSNVFWIKPGRFAVEKSKHPKRNWTLRGFFTVLYICGSWICETFKSACLYRKWNHFFANKITFCDSPTHLAGMSSKPIPREKGQADSVAPKFSHKLHGRWHTSGHRSHWILLCWASRKKNSRQISVSLWKASI